MHRTSRPPFDESWLPLAAQVSSSPQRRKRRFWHSLALCLALVLVMCLAMMVFAFHTAPQEIASEAMPETSQGPALSATPAWRRLTNEVFTVEYPSAWRPLSNSTAASLIRTSLEGADLSQITHIQGIAGPSHDGEQAAAVVMLLVIENPAYGGGITPRQLQIAEQATRQQLGSRLLAMERVHVDNLPGLACTHVDASQQYVIRNVIIFPPEPGVAYLMCCNTPIASAAETERIFAHMLTTLVIHRDAVPAAPVAPEAPPTRTLPSMPSVEARDHGPAMITSKAQR